MALWMGLLVDAAQQHCLQAFEAFIQGLGNKMAARCKLPDIN